MAKASSFCENPLQILTGKVLRNSLVPYSWTFFDNYWQHIFESFVENTVLASFGELQVVRREKERERDYNDFLIKQ